MCRTLNVFKGPSRFLTENCLQLCLCGNSPSISARKIAHKESPAKPPAFQQWVKLLSITVTQPYAASSLGSATYKTSPFSLYSGIRTSLRTGQTTVRLGRLALPSPKSFFRRLLSRTFVDCIQPSLHPDVTITA